MKSRIIMMAAAAVVCASVCASDVFVYMSGNFTPVAELGRIRKMVTTSTLTTLISEKGDTVTVENEAFSYITFHRTPVPTGISVAKGGETDISYSGGVVRVTAPEGLRRIYIYASDGTEIGRVNTRSSHATLSTAQIPTGVYAVEAVTAGGKTLVKKIIKK